MNIIRLMVTSFLNRPMIDVQIGNERYDRCVVHFQFEHRIRIDFTIGNELNERNERCGAHLPVANRSFIDFQIHCSKK